MKVAFEIEAGQARQNAMRDKKLAEPKKRRGAERAEQHNAREIKQESGRVFQGCYC